MFATQLVIDQLIPCLLLAQVNYDYPDNSNLPSTGFTHTPVYFNYKYLGISKQLIPWSKYQGAKNNKKTIHPNRQVWQYLYVACRVNQDGSRDYFYTAFDAETRRELVMPVVQSSRKLPRPLC